MNFIVRILPLRTRLDHIKDDDLHCVACIRDKVVLDSLHFRLQIFVGIHDRFTTFHDRVDVFLLCAKLNVFDFFENRFDRLRTTEKKEGKENFFARGSTSWILIPASKK